MRAKPGRAEAQVKNMAALEAENARLARALARDGFWPPAREALRSLDAHDGAARSRQKRRASVRTITRILSAVPAGCNRAVGGYKSAPALPFSNITAPARTGGGSACKLFRHAFRIARTRHYQQRGVARLQRSGSGDKWRTSSLEEVPDQSTRQTPPRPPVRSFRAFSLVSEIRTPLSSSSTSAQQVSSIQPSRCSRFNSRNASPAESCDFANRMMISLPATNHP
jgi:hypothetical protein